MYHDKDRDEFNNRMATKAKDDAKADVELSLRMAKTLKFIKFILAIIIVATYFYYPDYLVDLLVVGVVFSLILPNGFVDTFLQKLIALRAAETDERQILNATETNTHFSDAFKRIERLEKKN